MPPPPKKNPTLEQCKYDNGIPFQPQITPKIMSELQNITQLIIAIISLALQMNDLPLFRTVRPLWTFSCTVQSQ